MSEKLPKSCKKLQFKYICENCHYYSNNKTNFEKHLQTKKHNDTNGYKTGTKMIQMGTKKLHKCICGKSYVYIQGLYRHRNKCEEFKKSNDKITEKNVQIEEIIEKHSDKNIVININNKYYDNKVTHNNTNSNNNTNNTNNNTFSVKNYLNNECKDAYTVKQVLDNFECDLMKLPAETLPFYKDIVDKAFHNIPLEKLPIRCSDVKRKTFYGHTDVWNKDFDIVNEFIKKLVNSICEFRKLFVTKNPRWIDSDITTDILSSVIINVSKIYDENTVKKIIQHISYKTKIDK
tara:strand:- start:1079 stop:1948 length:870 start_codon:yes stop_codon:yes gene_type:complete